MVSSRASFFSRWFRRLLWTGAALAAASLVLLAVLRTPAVQTWAVNRLLAGQSGWKLRAEHIDVGPGGMEARGIDFSMPGISARAEPLAVRVEPGALLRRQLVVSQVALNQVSIEVTPSQLESSDSPLTGLLELLQAPLAWTVAKTDVNARVAINEDGRTLATGDLKLSGGGIKPAEPGTFNYEFTTASVFLPPGENNVVRSRGTVRVGQDGRNGIGFVELDGDLRLPAYGAFTFPDGRLKLRAEKGSAGERYALTITFGDEASVTLKTTLAPDAKHTTVEATFELKPALLARLDPKLATLGAFAGEVSSEVDLVSFAPARTQLTLKSGAAPFGLRLKQEDARHAARVWLDALPLAWANPWLEGAGAQVTSGTVAGEWDVAMDDSGAITVRSVKPLEIGPLALAGERLPAMLPISLKLSPAITLANEVITAEAKDLSATTAQGDRVDASVRIEHALTAGGRTRASGALTGALPTLLAGPERPLPFVAAAAWDATLEGEDVRVDTLEFFARKTPTSAPVVSLALRQPIRAGASLAKLKTDPTQDLLRFSVNGLPLSWVSRWLPDLAVNGTWAEGESTLRYAPGGEGFVFATKLPWTFTELDVAAGGKSLFAGSATFAPEFSYGDERQAAEVRALRGEDASGNRVEGSAMFEWRPRAKTFATTLSLDASLPTLPHSDGTFGPLTVVWRSRASTAEGAVSQVEQLAVEVRNADGTLASMSVAQPVFFANKPNGELIVSAVEPLRVKTAAVPFAWLRPWLPADLALEGTLAATELLLFAEPQKLRLRPVKPLRVERMSLARGGEPVVSDATMEFSPGLDVLVIHQWRPDFQLVFQGEAHATGGAVDLSGARAADFDAMLGFIGNTQTVMPQSIDAQARVDFAALRGTARDAVAAAVPPGGNLVLRANGHLLGREPLDLWARLDGVVDDKKHALPALEVSARGKVDGALKEARFDVGVKHLTTPVASDVAFEMTLGLTEGLLNFGSSLRSRSLDVGALLALAKALETGEADAVGKAQAVAVTALPKPEKAKAEPARAKRLGIPFWSVLRGHFDLELGRVKYAPYQIDDVRGRLDVGQTRLSFSGLTGTMFAGKWSGGLRIDYEPRAEADHFLTGGFRIEQFETARVVQTVFEEEDAKFGSFDAKVNLDAAVRSDGNSVWELMDRAEGEFSIEGRNGVARLTHPAAGTASTLLVLGGTVSFSPELRALGRLLKKFAEMPVDELRVLGERDASGNIRLTEFRLDSPQARLVGRGHVPADDTVALAGRPLELGLELFARDEVGVILGNMRLLESRQTVDGYRRMSQPFALRGEVGRPDASPLYDLLAKGAVGSKGTWGLIMRKVQQEVEKLRAKEAKS